MWSCAVINAVDTRHQLVIFESIMRVNQAQLLVIDDLFLRKLPEAACDELTEIIMNRYEKGSAMITSNRPIEDWGKLLGDVVAVTPMLDRIMHHGRLLKCEGKSWRLKEAAARLANKNVTD